MPLQMNQSVAQKYCREHHTDLATFRNNFDMLAAHSLCSNNDFCWIGLQKEKNPPYTWYWSDGDENSFRHWDINHRQPDNYFEESCAVLGDSGWFDIKCTLPNSALCYEDDPILVKENKTWEEALEHCRTLATDPNSGNTYFNHLYDLSHMRSGGMDKARIAILHAETEEVWIGLRFLAGSWLWVDGIPLQQLPVCPAPRMNCGTMSKTGALLPLRDCSERRNFFCSFKN